MLGGWINYWGCYLLCFSEYDFKGKSCDGYGVDWLFEYVDLVFWYDKIEEFVGVCGINIGYEDMLDLLLGIL